MAAMMRGRMSWASMTASTDPTETARWMLCTVSNSDATWPSFSERTELRSSASSVASRARSTPVVDASRPSSSVTRGSDAVRASTSRENTTAAAGAPPSTEANDPSMASTVMRGLSVLEKTTNAPPW